MTKIDIFSGFLGAGKTTLIKKLIGEGYKGEKLVLIENEFGEIGIDGGFLKDAGVNITEMNSGCICCSLVGDFGVALKKVLNEFAPDRILIEPSGVGKLSDVIKAVNGLNEDALLLNSYTAVVDVNKCKMYMKNFGEFFCDQIKHAKCIVLSHTQSAKEEKVAECIKLLKEENPNAVIVTTPWNELSADKLLSAIEGDSSLEKELHELEHEGECPHCHGHHHSNHHEHEHCHHDEHHCDHHHDEHEHCHHDEHHHEHECCCGHDHHEHHHHHADEVFTSFGAETAKKFSKEKISQILSALSNESEYGVILRAKGIVAGDNGEWIHFDYIPDSPDVRTGSPDIIGRICVIGSEINEEKIRSLFEL